ncbi:MAG: fluoride efflux transporter CrcB [Burkholderiales bacterium]
MAYYGVLAVGLGAAIGAWLRWTLASLNPLVAGLPIGTLVANLIGGYLVGLAVGYFADHAGLAPEFRLFVITGFLGGLTTFSTFSAETVYLLIRAQYGWALLQVFSHLAGSLLLTVLGMQTYKWFAQS